MLILFSVETSNLRLSCASTHSLTHSVTPYCCPYTLLRSSDEKEAAYTTINKLNTEQKKLNEQISRVTNQAASAERDAREKEEAFNRDQESSRRKNELNELLTKCRENENEFDRKVRPHIFGLPSLLSLHVCNISHLSNW